MYRYLFLIIVLLAALGCKSSVEKRINKDITGINEQLYDLEKKQIKDGNRLKVLEGQLGVVAQAQKKQDEEPAKDNLDKIYKDGYKNYLEQKYSEAVDIFGQLTQQFKNDSIVDNALYWQAESYLKMEKPDQALVYYQILYRYFPFSNKADYALYKIGMIYEDKKEFAMAQLAYQRLSDDYPASDLYKTVLLKLKQIKSNRRR